MAPDTITRELAKLAHALWCRKMAGEGWSYGPFDPERHTHDALVPFDRLSIHDQRGATLIIQAEEFESKLLRVMEYPRGPDRQFVSEELRVGLPVGWAVHVNLKDPLRDPATEVGTVESWEVDPVTGELTVIRVRWPDGEVWDHEPSLRDLRRVE